MAQVEERPGTCPQGDQRGSLPAAAAAAFAVLILFAMYLLREYDDNALLSWRWIFNHIDSTGLFITIGLSALAAYMISTLGLPGPGGLFVISVLLGSSFLPVPEVIIDTSRYFTQAKHLGQYGIGYFIQQWGGEIEAWTDLPLMPMVYGLGFFLFGEYRFVVQAIVLLMFAGTVSLTALLGTDLFGDRTGRLSGMFLLSMPFLYSQVPLMMVDVPSMFFLVLAVYAFRRSVKDGGHWAILLAPLFISMALFTKYSLWPMLSFTVPVLAVYYHEDKRAIRRCALTALVFSLIALPALWYLRDVMLSQIELLVSYQKPGLSRWGESLFSTFFFHVHPFVTLAALASLPLAIRHRERWFIPLVWLVVLVILVLDIRRIRYTIPLFPVIAIMAAYAVSRVGDWRLVRAYAYSALVTSFVLALAAYAPFLQSNSFVNLKLAGEHLDASGTDTVTVRTMPQRSVINPAVSVPLLDLYTQARVIYDYKLGSTMSPEEIEKSSFRFSWIYRNPQYYKAGRGERRSDVYVLVTPESRGLLKQKFPGMKLTEKYYINEGLFKFRPYVVIYKSYN